MKNKTIWVRLMALLLVVGVLLSFGSSMDGFVVRAGTAKERYEELEKELKELDNTIGKLSDRAEEAAERRKALAEQISVIKEQISILSGQIAAQQADIVAKQQEIDAKKQEMVETDDLFRQRIRSLYMVRNDGILTTVLGANTYAEALTAADTLQRITQADTQLLDTLQQQKNDLEYQEAQQQARLAELESNWTAMDEKQDLLAGTLQQVDTTLSNLEAQEEAAKAEYERLYEEYKKAKEEAEREFQESLQQSQNNKTEYVGGTFTWPTPGYTYISSPFGWRTLYGQPDNHLGIDITGGTPGVIAGAPIVAANDGYVTMAKYGDTGYGIRVYVDHGGGYITRYGHCSSLAVSAGEYVTKGQVIAYVGKSGNSTGYHLHFEVRKDGVAVDPMQFFTAA